MKGLKNVARCVSRGISWGISKGVLFSALCFFTLAWAAENTSLPKSSAQSQIPSPTRVEDNARSSAPILQDVQNIESSSVELKAVKVPKSAAEQIMLVLDSSGSM